MTDIGFYHLTSTPLERALPKLFEKILSVGKRAVLLCASQERLDALNRSLWTLGQGSFIPHGAEVDENETDQPIWLTLGDDNPNGASFLVQTDGAISKGLAGYERCLDVFDGNDPDAVQSARQRWTTFKGAGHTVTYWKQSPDGAWQKGA